MVNLTDYQAFKMHFIKTLLLVACATTALSVALPDAAAADAMACRDLGGVMRIKSSELPEGVSVSDVRKCVEHPHGRQRILDKASLAPFEANSTLAERVPLDLEERDAQKCYNAAPYGCDGGYCWKSCGKKGQWCWTAHKGGLGSWIKCKTFHDCGQATYACGRGGASGGCSC